MMGCKIVDFPAKAESVFLRIEVGEDERDTYSCTRRIKDGKKSDHWVLWVSAKRLEDVPELLKRARQFQRKGIEVGGTAL